MSRILVVDDDSGQRLILRSRLAESGHEAVPVETGARALVEARAQPFDVFLVSARLGAGIDGFELCRRLKGIPERAHVPIVLFSDQATSGDEITRGYEAGAESFVIRTDLPALEHVLRVLQRQRTLQHELLDQVRALQEALRRVHVSDGKEGELSKESGGDQAAALRELASSRPDGVLLVDAEGTVVWADRGASELFGARVESLHLGDLAPASGLEAFVRDARSEARDGLRFDLPARVGRAPRQLTTVVIPFLRKPHEAERGLRAVLLLDATRRRFAAEIFKLLEPDALHKETAALREAAREQWRPMALLGESAAIARVRARVATECASSAPLLLQGERGVGKERVARTLHFSGSSTGNFIGVRGGSRSAATLELELFGRARASGTSERPGLLHLAHDGTLFVEEVGELPAPILARLADFVEKGTLERVGATRAEKIDVRVIVSSSTPLETLVAQGRFPKEWWARIDDTLLEIPPLRERKEDIEPLARHFLEAAGGTRGVFDLDAEAWRVVLAYEWPGNVAELEDCMHQACARANNGRVALEHLPRALRDLASTASRDLIPRQAPRKHTVDGTHAVGEAREHELVPPPRASQQSRPPQAWDISDDEPVSLDLYERKALLRALDQVGGDKLKAAKLLRVGKSTLYRKLKRFNIA